MWAANCNDQLWLKASNNSTEENDSMPFDELWRMNLAKRKGN